MRFTKKIVLAVMTGVILTTSAIPSFAGQVSTSEVVDDVVSVGAFDETSVIPEREPRALLSKTVSPTIYWTDGTNKYEIGTVSVAVSYNYNRTTKVGSISTMRKTGTNVIEDFKWLRNSHSGSIFYIYTQNLDTKAKSRNTITFSVTSDGDITWQTSVSKSS